MNDLQSETIKKLVQTGQIKKLPYEEYKALSDDEAEQLIADGYATAPLTHLMASKEQKDKIRSYISQRILPINSTDLENITAHEASFLIEAATEKSFINSDFSKANERIEADTKPASDKQLHLIKELVEQGHLPHVSTENMVNMNNLTARRLIFKGTMNQKKGGY